MGNVTNVSGLRELGEALRGLSQDMALKASRQAVAAGASVVRKAARQAAPKDTGNLEKAIVMKRKRFTNITEEYNVAIRVGKRQDIKNAKAGKGALGKDAFYARFLEFGTVKMSPRPFLGPALEANVNQATEAMKKRLAARIERYKK